MHISKLDAAKRQLDTALNLYFKNGDPISIHTLTAASHQILMDLGAKSVIKDTALIRKGMEKEYLAIVNRAENFFKHAQRDQKELLEFNSKETDFLLFDAVEMYMQIANEQPNDMAILRIWFKIQNPSIISDEIQKTLRDKDVNYSNYAKMTRSEFYINLKSVIN